MAHALWLYSGWSDQRQILNLKFPLVIKRFSWFRGFKTPVCHILSISFLKDSFRCTGIGQQGLLGCHTRINLDMVLGTRKASNTIKNIWIVVKNLFLACNELGYHTFVVADFRLFFGYMYTDLGLGILWVVSTTSNKAGSRSKIVQSSVRLYQAKSKSCHTWYQNTAIITGYIEYYFLEAFGIWIYQVKHTTSKPTGLYWWYMCLFQAYWVQTSCNQDLGTLTCKHLQTWCLHWHMYLALCCWFFLWCGSNLYTRLAIRWFVMGILELAFVLTCSLYPHL